MGRKVLAMFYVGTDKLVHLDVYETEKLKAKLILEELRDMAEELLKQCQEEEQPNESGAGATGATENKEEQPEDSNSPGQASGDTV